MRGGVNTQVEVQSLPPASVIVRAADKDSVQQEVTLVEDVQAPVEKGQLLGKVVVHVAGSKIDEYDLVAAQTIEKMTFFNALKQLLGYLIQM